MNTPPWFAVAFWTLSLLGSAFYGWKAFEAFEVVTYKKKWGWWVHQVWFNFSGALVGWLATWVVVQDAWPCLASTCTASLNWSNGVLLGVAFVGVTGHLPFAVSGVLQAVRELAIKAAGLAK
jgi:hypothetical protein